MRSPPSSSGGCQRALATSFILRLFLNFFLLSFDKLVASLDRLVGVFGPEGLAVGLPILTLGLADGLERQFCAAVEG